MNIDSVLRYLQARRARCLTIGVFVALVLTGVVAPVLPQELSAVSSEFGTMLFLFCAAAVAAGIHLRSEWAGVMVGSAGALALRWLLQQHAFPLFSATASAPHGIAFFSSLPALAGFWVAWIMLLCAGGEPRRQRMQGAAIVCVTLLCALYNRINGSMVVNPQVHY